jgi:hypothetical protein
VTATSLLSRARLRSDRESRIVKLRIWQSCFDDGPHPSQRALGRQLGLYPSYVCKARHQSAGGWDALGSGTSATFDDLDQGKRS